MIADLRMGDWRNVLADVECDVLITDPPYSARVHGGHNQVLRNGELVPSTIGYPHWTDDDVSDFVASWAPRTRGWFCAMTSHDLYPVYRESLEGIGRYVFAPIPSIVRGMSLRLCGDGPSNWTVWLVVARPKTRAFASWGTLPGAYVTGNGGRISSFLGGKSINLMRAIVRDYSRTGDLVCDPCAGLATTGVAALELDRRFVGAEINRDTHARAVERLARPAQRDLFA